MNATYKKGKEEKEKLATELAAWKKNTLAQDQLLLAQQKVKKADNPDEIKAAKDMAPAPAAEPATEAAPVPAATPAPAAEPAKVKAKVKEDGKTTKQKEKKKDKKEEAPAGW